jgi:hypothetical protein
MKVKKKTGRKNVRLLKFRPLNYDNDNNNNIHSSQQKHPTLEFKINEYLEILCKSLIKKYGTNIGYFVFLDLRMKVLELYKSNPDLFNFNNMYEIIEKIIYDFEEPTVKAIRAKYKDPLVPNSFKKKNFESKLLIEALNKNRGNNMNARTARDNKSIEFVYKYKIFS